MARSMSEERMEELRRETRCLKKTWRRQQRSLAWVASLAGLVVLFLAEADAMPNQ